MAFTKENTERLERIWAIKSGDIDVPREVVVQEYKDCLKKVRELDGSNAQAWSEELTVSNEYSKLFAKEDAMKIIREVHDIPVFSPAEGTLTDIEPEENTPIQ